MYTRYVLNKHLNNMLKKESTISTLCMIQIFYKKYICSIKHIKSIYLKKLEVFHSCHPTTYVGGVHSWECTSSQHLHKCGIEIHMRYRVQHIHFHKNRYRVQLLHIDDLVYKTPTRYMHNLLLVDYGKFCLANL